jgi:hypothetical protein
VFIFNRFLIVRMSTLRQKVDQFCVAMGTTNASSLRIAKLEEDLKKAKEDLKTYKKDVKFQKEQTRKAAKAAKAAPKAKTQRVKMTDEEKAQRRRDRAAAKQLAPAPTAAVPVAAPSLAPMAPITKVGRGKTRRTKRPTMRW